MGIVETMGPDYADQDDFDDSDDLGLLSSDPYDESHRRPHDDDGNGRPDDHPPAKKY